MNLSKCIFSIFSVGLLGFFMGSCNSNDSEFSEDPFGIAEAEQDGGQSERLIQCSEDESCPKHAEALFWVAADLMSKAGEIEVEIDAADLGLTPDMTAQEITDQIGSQADELLSPEKSKYDIESREFKRALSTLQRADAAGSLYAANELGLLYLEDNGMQNFDVAEEYFRKSLAAGDHHAAFNLAGVSHRKFPRDHEQTLAYLKLGAESEDPQFNYMYHLGLEEFGNPSQKNKAKQYFESHSEENDSLRKHFNAVFDLIEQDNQNP